MTWRDQNAAPAGIGAGKVKRVRSGIQPVPLRLTVTVVRSA